MNGTLNAAALKIREETIAKWVAENGSEATIAKLNDPENLNLLNVLCHLMAKGREA